MSMGENMENKSLEVRKDGKNIGLKIVSQILAIAVFTSVGFCAGNFYSLSKNKGNLETLKTEGNSIKTTTVSDIVTLNNNETQLSVTDIAKLAENSVVEISTEITASNSFLGKYTATGNGSGVIISQDGYIITNNHVVNGASQITVRLKDGTEYKAKVIGTDSKTDIAVIKIEANNLTPIVVGDSSKLAVGELAVVIGNPLGQLGGTVTDGIISALEREITIDGNKMNLIQTNAAINPGNSGGALLNKKGELVGIVIAKSSGLDIEGLGFAIPINDVKEVIQDIQNVGYVTGRPYLGVELSDTVSYGSQFSFFTQYGVYVSNVIENSSADEAGIKKGDIITAINDTAVSDASSVSSLISSYEIGEKITIQIIRGNKLQNVQATLKEYKGDN